VNDHAFGLAWSGQMRADRLIRLADQLPPGLNEIYFHPATRQDEALATLMPDYEHAAELDTLLSPAVRDAFQRAGVQLVRW
jgi:chitin disaccharide deacetylase